MTSYLEARLEILDGGEHEEIGPLMVRASLRPDARHHVVGELQLVHRSGSGERIASIHALRRTRPAPDFD
jgi:hypothetical protein